ncbi:MAG TPA: LysR family transcriptional regulator [Myxococcaceae bacterium]|nr:LysR family transcriptional regulator [Myxococcaceae bacterium]
MHGGIPTDWEDLRFFLAVARGGSLSAAARDLGVSQPTVGRRLAAFELRLGAKLLRRTPLGQVLSSTGEAVLTHAVQMEEAALAAMRLASGRDSGLEGLVRLTASEWLVIRVLGPLLVPFLQRNPGISVELVANARWLSLPRRDTDVALRPAQFEHQEVIQREVAQVGFGLYASHAYLSRNGQPDFGRQCEGHALVSMTEEGTTPADVPWLRAIAARARVAARANGREALASMGSAGLGLVCLPRCVGDATPGLERLETPTPAPERRLWLGMHRDSRRIPRVRALGRHLVEALVPLRGSLRP